MKIIAFYTKQDGKYRVVQHKPGTEQTYVVFDAQEAFNKFMRHLQHVTDITGNTVAFDDAVVDKLEADWLANRYEAQVSQYIRQRYSVNAEIAIIRQRDDKPTEYQAYYDYCEECKQRARADLGL